MKLSIMLSVGVCASVLAYNAYSLTCGAQPSCSSLGYTYSGSTTDCLNTPLKCPFNTSYFNCTKKADVVKNMVLDWSKKQSINPRSSTYYVKSYGIVIGKIKDITNSGGDVSINGISVSATGVPEVWTNFYAQVAPGDYIKASGRNENFYFVPYKNL